MKAAESAKPNLTLINLSLEAQQQARAAEASEVSMNKAKLAQAAQELLDNPAMNEEKRKARAKNAEDLIKLTSQGTFASADELEQLFKVINRDEKSLAMNMGRGDFSTLNNEYSAAAFSSFINNADKDADLNDTLLTLRALVPDSVMYDKLFALIANVDSFYVAPYQQAAEVLAEMYKTFSSINTSVSAMISSGTVNTEENKITLTVWGLANSIDELHKQFYDPSSPLVIKLQAIRFTPADKGKAEQLIEGSGLVLAGGPPGDYWLAISPAPHQNLIKAFDALIPNYSGSSGSVSVTTYQLQAFQTAFNSVGEQMSSEMQTTAEKYRRTISQNDSFVKLLSAFLQANIDANKQYLQ